MHVLRGEDIMTELEEAHNKAMTYVMQSPLSAQSPCLVPVGTGSK